MQEVILLALVFLIQNNFIHISLVKIFSSNSSCKARSKSWNDFCIDWSGSMQECILETTKQLLQLVWFCKKQNIPFDVYCFTNSWDKYCSNS